MSFDPNAAAAPDAGIFGLPFPRDQARIVLLPVPFEATTSYGAGTAGGPEAILAASRQIDLFDHRFGRVYEQGIFMAEPDERVRTLGSEARAVAGPLVDKGGAGPEDVDAVRRVDAACAEVNALIASETAAVLREGKVPGLIGGEHACSLGAIAACADARGPIGVLQIDAHMDLRESFEGFRFSHASIMFNVLAEVPGVERIVQVGIRDYCEAEREIADGAPPSARDRVRVQYWDDLADELDAGTPFRAIARRIVDQLPERVYISTDIDGLDPVLCPHTGTPVPGGLSFQQLSILLEVLRVSGREVVGFDLVEVAPDPSGGSEWDGAVGARVLYRLCGAARPQ